MLFEDEEAKWDNSFEVLTEHLTFVPTCFVDDVINAANTVLYQALQGIATHLRENLGIVGDDCEKILMDIETLYENSIDVHFDKFEIFVLKNIFSIPKDLNLVLPHYQEFQKSLSTPVNATDDIEDEDELDLQLKNLRNEILAENYYKSELVKLIKNIDAKKARLHSFIENLDKVFEKERKLSDVNSACIELSKKVHNLRKSLKKTQRITRDGKFKEIMGKVDERTLYISSTISKYLAKNSSSNEGKDDDQVVKRSDNLITLSECNVESRVIGVIGNEKLEGLE